MICKKVSKDKSLSKTNSTKGQKSKQVIDRRHSAAQSSPSGVKTVKGKSKKSASADKKKTNDKKCDKLNGHNETKTKKSIVAEKEIKSTNNKSKKRSKIEKIKEVAKKVKSKTSDKVKLVIKRNLRNNCKIESDLNTDFVNHRKMKESSDCGNKKANKNFDTKILNTKNNNEKPSVKHVSQKSSKTNLCSKLFPTLDSNKPTKLKTKWEENDSKARLRNHFKTEDTHKVTESKPRNTDNNNKKSQNIDSSNKKSNNNNNINNKKVKQVKKDKQSKSAKQTASKVVKDKKEPNGPNGKSSGKSPTKLSKPKNGIAIRKRGHRVASLNAIAKVRLMCETEKEKSEPFDKYGDRLKDKQTEKKEKNNRKTGTKSTKCESKSRKNECKALVPVDNRKAIAIPRKRKMIDDCVEIIDTRSCKRMASLNASAIMAASYSPERIKRSKSVESNHSNSSVEMVREMKTFSQTVSRYEISPSLTALNAINGIHVNQVSHQNSVIVSAQKHETIETVKQLKVSNKIKDRLLGIARLERQEKAKQKRLEKKNQRSLTNEDNMLTNPEMSGFQATKVQVTKVTHINASQGVKCVDKDKKKAKHQKHQINSILETDSSIVHKYQVQTKATIQMQTTYNSNAGPSMANVTTMTAPPPAALPSVAPRMQIHLTETPMMHTPGPPPGQPTYYSLGTTSPAVVQVHNNFQTLGPSTSAFNPMSIINLSEPYPPHYSSAFSVPHFATHTHPSQSPFTYLNPGLYQPAGPLLQGFQDQCLIHKPIPFHPPAPQVNHIHPSAQFSNASSSAQTFTTDLSQPFAASPQFYPQMQTPMRPPQTVYFQAMPQANGTGFTLLNPGVHYSHPTFIGEQLAPNRENSILTNENNYLDMNKIISDDNTTNINLMATQASNASAQQIGSVSKSSQCSPQMKDQSKKRQENHCNSINSSNDITQHQRNANPNDNQTKKTNRSEKSHKKKKSLLLNPSSLRNNEEVIHNNRNNCSQLSDKQNDCESGEQNGKNGISSNSTKTNSISKHKNMKTACVQVSPSLPSVDMPSRTDSPSERQSVSKRSNKKRFSHGWSWEGSPKHKYVYLNNEEQSYLRKCYPAIRHNEGDIIKVRDCVILRSGPRKTDLPFVAKISALWESPEGEMMMSLFWYYRPEHTDLEYYSNQMCAEIFASKHRDTNSVACIDDKCYVLTYNEFCRYRRSKLINQCTSGRSLTSLVVPGSDEPYPRADRIPPPRVFPELVFCCRKVYDYRQKRILKNPI